MAPTRRKLRFALSKEGESPLDLQNHVPFLLAALTNLLKVDRDPLVRTISRLQSRELRVLLNIGSYAPVRAAEVAYQSRLGTHTVSRAVKALVGEGLVRVVPDALDQRRAMLSLTDEGRRLYDQIARILSERADRLLDIFDPEEQSLFRSMLERLEDRAEEVLAEEALDCQRAGRRLSADQRELLRWFKKGMP